MFIVVPQAAHAISSEVPSEFAEPQLHLSHCKISTHNLLDRFNGVAVVNCDVTKPHRLVICSSGVNFVSGGPANHQRKSSFK